MPAKLSRRVRELQPSATFKLARRARDLKAAGKDVLLFGLGEPDFDTPEPARKAAIAAIHGGQTHYTANEGILPLRQAIAQWQQEEQGITYDAGTEVLVTAGAKQAIAQALLALVDDGDEVLIPTPYWVSYPEQVRLALGTSRYIPTTKEHRFHLQAKDLDAAVTDRSRVLILNTPNNPSGAVLTRAELEAIAEVAIRRDLIVISDEIYGPLTYSSPHVSIAATSPEMKDRTIVCHGMSKGFAMTGWRLGFAAGPKEVIDAMGSLQGHITSNASSISQHAALEAVRSCRGHTEAMKAEFDERRRFVTERLRNLPGIAVADPEGAFYAFFTIDDLVGRRTPSGVKIENSASFCTALLDQGLVSLVPGSVFGCENAVRLSYAASMESLKEGLRRIEQFVKDLDEG